MAIQTGYIEPLQPLKKSPPKVAGTSLVDQLITYTDYGKFINELLEKMPQLVAQDDDGETSLTFKGQTPTVTNKDGEGMFLARDDGATFLEMSAKLVNSSILGTYDEVFADSAKKITYDRIYDQTPITYTDPDTGEEITYTPPPKFGVFFDLYGG
jgi:hypothetical protein